MGVHIHFSERGSLVDDERHEEMRLPSTMPCLLSSVKVKQPPLSRPFPVQKSESHLSTPDLGRTQLRCLKDTCIWVTNMWISYLLGPHVIDIKVGALRHRSTVHLGRISHGRCGCGASSIFVCRRFVFWLKKMQHCLLTDRNCAGLNLNKPRKKPPAPAIAGSIYTPTLFV